MKEAGHFVATTRRECPDSRGSKAICIRGKGPRRGNRHSPELDYQPLTKVWTYIDRCMYLERQSRNPIAVSTISFERSGL